MHCISPDETRARAWPLRDSEGAAEGLAARVQVAIDAQT